MQPACCWFRLVPSLLIQMSARSLSTTITMVGCRVSNQALNLYSDFRKTASLTEYNYPQVSFSQTVQGTAASVRRMTYAESNAMHNPFIRKGQFRTDLQIDCTNRDPDPSLFHNPAIALTFPNQAWV